MANTYRDILERIAAALENGGGAAGVLSGRRYDFATDDGVRACLADAARALGAEVVNG